MRVSYIRLQNFRSFVDCGVFSLANINVLIGANNACKSSVLRGIHQLQEGVTDPFGDVRVGAVRAHIEIGLEQLREIKEWGVSADATSATYTTFLSSPNRRNGSIEGTLRVSPALNKNISNARLQAMEPHHFVIPYLSKRKAATYIEDTREERVLSIMPDVSNLSAKLLRLGNPSFPGHEKYALACKEILGFVVTAIPSPTGWQPGIYLPSRETIPISQLGEGVPNIVYFLVSLAVSEGKLFLVEEPENDLHPQALKALLDVIIESSKVNQFVISTHSNIVVRHLCSVPESLLFRVWSKSMVFPLESEIELVPDTADSRLSVLGELGYSLSDFELWDGWLILEESSAERIIRDYLVPWFAPSLSRIRTISSGGATKINATFEDLHRLFLFTHLTPTYREKSWVLADGDEAGVKAIEKLKGTFLDHDASRFQTFREHAFEQYFPKEFAQQVVSLLSSPNGDDKRFAKKKLLEEVMEWLDADKVRGRAALAESAGEVIEILRRIEVNVTKNRYFDGRA
jgi:hypothetical protein